MSGLILNFASDSGRSVISYQKGATQVAACVAPGFCLHL